jgi:hypothetical protein
MKRVNLTVMYHVAATRYKVDDFKPYLYRTTDYGKTWTKIVSGIPADHFTRVIRADPKRKGLLYAGTERVEFVARLVCAGCNAMKINFTATRRLVRLRRVGERSHGGEFCGEGDSGLIRRFCGLQRR